MTDRYAVIGNPIGHSKSPLIHTMFAEATGQDMTYDRIEAAPGDFAAVAGAFREGGGKGLNVTAPFKLDAFAMATKLSDAARLAGAVNALWFDGDEICGENFDGKGLVRDIVHNLQRPIAGSRVLLLGAGGAARGALLPIVAEGPASLVIANRSVARAEAMASALPASAPVRVGGYDAIGAAPFDIVINATSASLTGELPPLSGLEFAPATLAYELAYGKGLTPFLKLARGGGVVRIADGVGMLVEQAAEAFQWWRGIRPATEAAIARITVPLV